MTLKTKVTKTETHDRLAVSAKFQSGGDFKFYISRSGERMSFCEASDRLTTKKQSAILGEWIKPIENESNRQRLNRISACLIHVGSVAELVAAVEPVNFMLT